MAVGVGTVLPIMPIKEDIITGITTDITATGITVITITIVTTETVPTPTDIVLR